MPVHAIGPVDLRERIAVLDLWRGVALLGVCVVNFVLANDLYLPQSVAQALPTAGLDWRVQRLLALLVSNKANTVFTLLFGIGIALMCERIERAGRNPNPILFRRMIALLALGWVHFLLLYQGDLLHIYALGGLLLIVLRRAPCGVVFVMGVLLAVTGRLFYEERLLLAPVLERFGFMIDAVSRSGAADTAARYATLRSGDVADLIATNVKLALDTEGQGLYRIATGTYYMGRMLLGFALWRSGMLQRLFDAPPRALVRLSAILLGCALAGHVVFATSDIGPAASLRHAAFNLLRQVVILLQASGYLAALVWVARTARSDRVLGAFQAVGRMSLTNYVLQSVAMFVLLYGAGLRLAGQVGATVVVALALVTYAVQVVFSTFYLRRHARGPLEQWWRKLTYGHAAERRVSARQRVA